MEGYKFSPGATSHWYLFAEETIGFCTSDAPQIAQVLFAVRRVFVDTFGADVVDSHPTLSVIYADSGPVTFREHHLIFLSSKGRFHQQQIYQFAHELCHFMVPSDVCKNYRWFEETLCKMMSWYALQRIFDSRFTNPIPAFQGLYEYTQNYISKSKAGRLHLKGISLAKFLTLNLSDLQQNCYLRDANSTVAYELYPLFESHPELWMIVPELHRLTDDMDLTQAIRFLCDAADVPKALCAEVVQLLCQ